MKVVMPGGTGQVGNILATAFHNAGHEVIVLSRRASSAPWRVVAWDAETVGDWMKEIEGADVVINLAGRNVNCRYTPENRRLIMESRVKSTRAVGDAISHAANPPRVWLQASTATIYAHRYDAANDEKTGVLGGSEPNAPLKWRYSIEVATAWEKVLNDSVTPHTRKVALRTSLVMSPDRGSIFDVLLSLIRFGLGGAAGNGRQYVSWIHFQDYVRTIFWLLDHPEIDSPVNLTAPNPLPNANFMRILRKAWGMPIGLPSTAWMLEIGAIPLQTETELVLKSRRVAPTRLIESGFVFQFPNWSEAAEDLCQRWRQGNQINKR